MMRRGELRRQPGRIIAEEHAVSDSMLIVMLTDCGLLNHKLLSVDKEDIERPFEPHYAFGMPVALNFS